MISKSECVSSVDEWPREAKMVAMDLVRQVATLHDENMKLHTTVRELSKRMLEK